MTSDNKLDQKIKNNFFLAYKKLCQKGEITEAQLEKIGLLLENMEKQHTNSLHIKRRLKMIFK